MKNADVLLMVQNHFDDDTLVKIIEVSDSDFDISGNALVELKRQGVSSQVLRAMLAAVQKKHVAPQPSQATDTTITTATTQPTPANETKPATASSESAEPAFATRTDGDAPVSTSPAPTSNSVPATHSGMTSRAMPMGVNAQQMAAMQSQLASMGMGGMMGGMGAMGGLGGGIVHQLSPRANASCVSQARPQSRQAGGLSLYRANRTIEI